MNHSINDSTQALPENSFDKAMPTHNKLSLVERLENIMSLSQLLRFVGAIALLASMSLFMFKGWSEGNDISRYLKLLAQTGLITTAGLILSFVIKEAKGARVFFGLGLASVVANFTILGALTYSLFPVDSLLMDYPDMMQWEVTSLSIFLPTFIGASLLLSFVSFFGFSVFARKFAKPITFGFLVLCALLLVPLRAPLAAAALAGFAFLGAYFLINRIRKSESFLATFEIKVAFGLLLLPGSIIVSRALSFYAIDDLSLMAFTTLAFAVIRMVANSLDLSQLWARILKGAQFTLGFIIAILLGDIIPDAMNLEHDAYQGIIIAITIIGFSLEQIFRSNDNTWNQWITSVCTCLIVPISLLSTIGNDFFQGIHTFQTLIITGLVVVLNVVNSNITGSRQVSFSASVVGFAIAIILVLINIIELIQLSNWVIVGMIGGALIVGASLYERYGLSFSHSKKVS